MAQDPFSTKKGFGAIPTEGARQYYGGGRAAPTQAAPAPEQIVSAAVKINGRTYLGTNHYSAIERAAKDLGVSFDDITMGKVPMQDFGGFVTTHGRYLSRKEALDLARLNGQVSDRSVLPTEQRFLGSENLKLEQVYKQYLDK